jgi:hypothetical protein
MLVLAKLFNPIWENYRRGFFVFPFLLSCSEPSIQGAARDRIFFFNGIKVKHSLLIAALNE